jgi:hypothetical protein
MQCSASHIPQLAGSLGLPLINVLRSLHAENQRTDSGRLKNIKDLCMSSMQFEERLRPVARERIRQGLLPCDPTAKVWGGKGAGEPCSLCDQGIEPAQVEYEVEHQDARGDMKIMRFHMTCERIWRLECTHQD